MTSWAELSKANGIKYFLVSFVDLFGVMRAKLVPAVAMDEVAGSGAGFAGFAAWFDMTPADPDVLVMPEQGTMIQLPWKPFRYLQFLQISYKPHHTFQLFHSTLRRRIAPFLGHTEERPP